MSTIDTTPVLFKSFHAHIYFSADDEPRAEELADKIEAHFGDRIQRGRWHTQPVGPHPRGSCQISFEGTEFADVMPWLVKHRNAVTLFVHANSGDDLRDHTDHVLWLGDSETLKLNVFKTTTDTSTASA